MREVSIGSLFLVCNVRSAVARLILTIINLVRFSVVIAEIPHPRHVVRIFTLFNEVTPGYYVRACCVALFVRRRGTCSAPDDRTTRYRALFDVVAHGGSKIEPLMRFSENYRRINGRQPVLLNDVNPTSFRAIRNTNGGVRSDLSRLARL